MPRKICFDVGHVLEKRTCKITIRNAKRNKAVKDPSPTGKRK